MYLGQYTQFAYQIQTKFRMSYILNGEFRKILDRNVHTVKISNNKILGFDNHQTILNYKISHSKISLENSIYYDLNKVFKIPVVMGFYTRNKIGLDSTKPTLREKYSLQDFQQQQISFQWNGSILNYNENQDSSLNQITTNNIYLAVLNLAKYSEGNILHEVNVKLRNNIITGDFRLA